MNSHERVLMSLNHEQPDRVPRNFWAEPATWNRVFEYVQYRDADRLLDELNIDIRVLEPSTPSEKEVEKGLFQNFWGERYIYRETPWGPNREDVSGALANAENFDDLENFPWPTPDDFDYSVLPEQCRRWNELALIYGFADVWQRPGLVRGFQNAIMDMCERPDWSHYLSRVFTDFYKEDYTRAMEITKGRIDMFRLISDLGMQKGPLISRKMFLEFVAPYIKEMCDHIHALGAKVHFHSCGNVRTLILDLIELGIDILDPLQPVPGMEPETLKKEFGDRVCFHGGIDTQQLLPFGSVEDVLAHSRKYQEILGAGGGYILAPAHFFQPDTPAENIFAVYQDY